MKIKKAQNKYSLNLITTEKNQINTHRYRPANRQKIDYDRIELNNKTLPLSSINQTYQASILKRVQ